MSARLKLTREDIEAMTPLDNFFFQKSLLQGWSDRFIADYLKKRELNNK